MFPSKQLEQNTNIGESVEGGFSSLSKRRKDDRYNKQFLPRTP
jgi:hypothetical protein